MNGYICFYKNQPELSVYALTTLEAQTKAAAHFKAKKAYQVTVGLAETNIDPVTGHGQQVIHVADL